LVILLVYSNLTDFLGSPREALFKAACPSISRHAGPSGLVRLDGRELETLAQLLDVIPVSVNGDPARDSMVQSEHGAATHQRGIEPVFQFGIDGRPSATKGKFIDPAAQDQPLPVAPLKTGGSRDSERRRRRLP